MYEPNTRPQANLSVALRDLRRAAGLSGERLAARAALSQSKLSRIECGSQLPSIADTERILKALAVPSDKAGELLALARAANVDYVSYRSLARVGLWRRQTELKALVDSSRVVRQFSPAIPTGLLQTREYAYDVLTPSIEGQPARDVARVVDARMSRQASLNDGSRRFHFVLTEQALRWQYSDTDTVLGLLTNIGKVAQQGNVDVAILPLTAREVRSAPLNTFTVYDERIVTAEMFSGSIALRDPRDVTHHIHIFEYFREQATDGTDATALLESIANEIAQQRG